MAWLNIFPFLCFIQLIFHGYDVFMIPFLVLMQFLLKLVELLIFFIVLEAWWGQINSLSYQGHGHHLVLYSLAPHFPFSKCLCLLRKLQVLAWDLIWGFIYLLGLPCYLCLRIYFQQPSMVLNHSCAFGFPHLRLWEKVILNEDLEDSPKSLSLINIYPFWLI